jgi:hypothetical protein
MILDARADPGKELLKSAGPVGLSLPEPLAGDLDI